MYVLPTLGPEVCKSDLLWASRSHRANYAPTLIFPKKDGPGTSTDMAYTGP